jgi:hypothetical protein
MKIGNEKSAISPTSASPGFPLCWMNSPHLQLSNDTLFIPFGSVVLELLTVTGAVKGTSTPRPKDHLGQAATLGKMWKNREWANSVSDSVSGSNPRPEATW